MMSKFEELFGEPQCWGNVGWVFSRETLPSREEAAAHLADWFYAGHWTETVIPIDPSLLREDTVVFRFVGREECDDWDTYQINGRLAMWAFGNGRGAKPVWVLEERA